MQMNVQEVAQMLAVAEDLIHQWAEDGSLPATLVDEQFRFNRAEILQWAAERNRRVSVPGAASELEGAPGLADALALGGIHFNVPGGGMAAFLANALDRSPLPPGVDRCLLLQVLAAREQEGSTAIGGGIAVPHMRYPIVGPVPAPWIRLCFAAEPLDLHAPDGQKVRAVFLAVSPSVRSHLQLLALLFSSLQAGPFREAVMSQAPAERILQACRLSRSGPA